MSSQLGRREIHSRGGLLFAHIRVTFTKQERLALDGGQGPEQLLRRIERTTLLLYLSTQCKKQTILSVKVHGHLNGRHVNKNEANQSVVSLHSFHFL
jgi:hypothetical protein